jgi:hypothetical protein
MAAIFFSAKNRVESGSHESTKILIRDAPAFALRLPRGFSHHLVIPISSVPAFLIRFFDWRLTQTPYNCSSLVTSLLLPSAFFLYLLGQVVLVAILQIGAILSDV